MALRSVAGSLRPHPPVRRWLPALLVVAVVLGVASSGGAQVDPPDPSAPAVWGASCVGAGASEMVVYGRGWIPTDVAIEAVDQSGAGVGSTSLGAVERQGSGAVFQGRIALSVPDGASSLRLLASQSGRRAEHAVTVAGQCSLTLAASVSAPDCAPPAGPVSVMANVRGAPASTFEAVHHHVDLFGPAEAVVRTAPSRPDGFYAIPITVPNVPGRVVPVTVEARRSGGYAYATALVTLPPACAQPNTTAPAPATTVPATTQPTSPATTAAPSTGPPATLPPITRPQFGGPASIGLSLTPSIGRAGEATTVSGRGFPPSTPLTLRWRPGIGEWRVTAGGDGSFRTQVLVLPKDIEGRRVLEVLEGGATPAPYLVVPGSDQPAFGGVFVPS